MLQDDAIDAARILEKGAQLSSENSLDSAEACFAEALAGLNELVAQTLFGLGKIACKRSEFDKALDYLARAREAEPCLSDAYCLTAEIYFALNDTEKAKEWCEKTLEINWNVKNAHIILSWIDLSGPDYYANIEMIHNFLRPATYLEIGVHHGDTLKFAADDTMAIGVDPSPAVEVPLGRLTRVFEKTCDDFFNQVDLVKEFAGQPVELAFIDGMHQFEYALRDFINIEKYCTENSVVMVHDCCPLDEITAARERVTEFWSGDIWKLIVCLKKYRPDLCINVIKTAPTGLAIIKGLNKESRILADNLQKIYEEFIEMDYQYLHEDKMGKLNLVTNDWDVIKGILTL
jgi:tetratricopeptide (TPR) repeat protein